MTITIESTDIITAMDGVPVRLWRGITDRGYPVNVFVHRLSARDDRANRQMQDELRERPAPMLFDDVLMILD